jgi:DNA-binding transcriptional regulator PaaX
MDKLDEKILKFLLNQRETVGVTCRTSVSQICEGCGLDQSQALSMRGRLENLRAHNWIDTAERVGTNRPYVLTEKGLEKALELQRSFWAKANDNKWVYLIVGLALSFIVTDIIVPWIKGFFTASPPTP